MNQNQKNFIAILNNPHLITTSQASHQFLNIFNQICQEKESQFIFDGSTYCKICYQNIDCFPFQMLSCGHNVHKKCLQNSLNEQSPNLDLSMYLLGCCVPVNNEDLFEAFGRNYVEEVWDRALMESLSGNELKQKQQIKPPVQQKQEKVDKATLDLIEQMRKEDLKKQQEIEKAVEFMCNICFFTHSVELEGITLDCNHRFCKESLGEYITSKLKEGEFKENQIVCPTENCQTPITIHIIQYCAPAEVYQKILDLRSNNVQTKNKHETFIRCPTANCVGKYIGDPKTTPFMECVFCQKYFCTNGCPQAHKDLTCQQFRTKYNKEMQIKGMECPKCHVMIVKDEGCNHITCQCKHQFCYLCGADWVPRKCKCKKQGIMDNIYDFFFGSNN